MHQTGHKNEDKQLKAPEDLVTTENIEARYQGQRSDCTYMDEADFSEDPTLKQQEHEPGDGGLSQRKLYNDDSLTSKNDICDASDQIISTVDDPQEKATYKATCRNVDSALMLEKGTENAVKEKHDTNLHIPANKGNLSKSNISEILLHHLSKEEFLKGQGINSETLPEISTADSFVEAIVKDIILCYVKNSWPKEQTPELTDQLNPKRVGGNSNKPSCSLTITEENTSGLGEPVASADSSHPENSNFLTKTESPRDKQKSCQGQTPQKQQTEKARSSNGFIYGQGQVHYRSSDCSKVGPKVKIPNIIDKLLTTDKQTSFSPELRDKLAIVQDILGSTCRSNCVEIQEREIKTTEPSQQAETSESLQEVKYIIRATHCSSMISVGLWMVVEP